MKDPECTLILGPMFAGKTTELIRRIERAKVANKKILVIKPDIDTRYDRENVVTHLGNKYPCLTIDRDLNKFNIKNHNVDIVFLDEAQFFINLYNFVFQTMKEGINIVITSLNGDYNMKNIGETHTILPLVTEILLLPAVCSKCGKDAYYSYLKIKDNNDNNIKIGGMDKYEARCFSEFFE